MIKFFSLILLVALSYNLYAQKEHLETLNNKIIVDSIFSNKINDNRTVKIYLPEEYSEDTKYPIIYTLDGDWMFSPLVNQLKVLIDFEVIPKSIVVGIFHDEKRNSDLSWDWNSGKLTESGSLFYQFLTEELVSYINTKFSSSGFNVLVGHSNSATFSHIILTKENQPFNGFIALSQNLSKSQIQKYAEFSKLNHQKNKFYFVASGKFDNHNRLKTGVYLDSLFNTYKPNKLHTKHSLYNAEHNNIVGKALKDGIEHIFSMYKHYNGENITFIDSLHSKNINLIEFIEANENNIKETYGLQTKIAFNHHDAHFLSIGSRNKQELIDVLNYQKEKLGVDEWFYFSYAQLFEYKGYYEESLKYWLKNLDNNYERDRENIFSLKRTIELVYGKMKEPERAINLALKWKKEYPQFSQNVNYWIAKITSDKGIHNKKGKKAINKYIRNYIKPEPIELDKAKELEMKLKK